MFVTVAAAAADVTVVIVAVAVWHSGDVEEQDGDA